MTSKSRQLAAILFCSCFFTLTTAATSQAAAGQDWYCPDSHGHDQYEQHRRQYHDHNVEQMVGLIEKIYSDQNLSAENRKEMTTGLLADYSAKLKLGVGD